MANSISSAGGLPLPATSTSHAWRSQQAATEAAGKKKGKNAGLFNLIRLRFWGREKSAEHADGAPAVGAEEDGLRRYGYGELRSATEGFSPKRIIGEGSSGVVYRGVLNKVDVAVKMIVGGSEHRQRDYVFEIKVIGRLRHPNVVRLLGYCHEGEHLLLVHEFMPNGALTSHLYRPELSPLPWEVRYHRVVAGLTSALSYLQSGWERCVVHRDIKPSNIMLDSHFHPKLTDFELARITNDRDSELDVTDVVAGTTGYLAPEFVSNGRFSRESDIFALGVVILEVGCGRKPIDRSQERGRRGLLQWVSDLDREGRILEAADPRLGDAFDKQEMKQLLTLGLMCTRFEPHLRPPIADILKTFESSALPPRDLLPEQDASSATPPAEQLWASWTMGNFLSDALDYTQVFDLRRRPTAAAGPAGGSRKEANATAAAAASSSPVTKSDSGSARASRASSDSVLTSEPDEQKPEVASPGQAGQGDAPCPAAQDDGHLESGGESGFWDIGIPPGHLAAASPLKDHHRPISDGCVAGLHQLLQSQDEPLRFDEVLGSVRQYTTCLVAVGAPLVEWNVLAQQALRASKAVNAFPGAATVSSLRASASECARAADEHEAMAGSAEEELSAARREHLALVSAAAELGERIERSEQELESMKQKAARQRELQGKLSSILNQYESTLSKLSSFAFT